MGGGGQFETTPPFLQVRNQSREIFLVNDWIPTCGYLPSEKLQEKKGNLLRIYLSNRESRFHTHVVLLALLVTAIDRRPTSRICGRECKNNSDPKQCFSGDLSNGAHALFFQTSLTMITYSSQVSVKPELHFFIYQEIKANTSRTRMITREELSLTKYACVVLHFGTITDQFKKSTDRGRKNVSLEEEALLLVHIHTFSSSVRMYIYFYIYFVFFFTFNLSFSLARSRLILAHTRILPHSPLIYAHSLSGNILNYIYVYIYIKVHGLDSLK